MAPLVRDFAGLLSLLAFVGVLVLWSGALTGAI